MSERELLGHGCDQRVAPEVAQVVEPLAPAELAAAAVGERVSGTDTELFLEEIELG